MEGSLKSNEKGDSIANKTTVWDTEGRFLNHLKSSCSRNLLYFFFIRNEGNKRQMNSSTTQSKFHSFLENLYVVIIFSQQLSSGAISFCLFMLQQSWFQICCRPLLSSLVSREGIGMSWHNAWSIECCSKICLKLNQLQKITLAPLDSRVEEKALQGIKTRGDRAQLFSLKFVQF